MKKKHKIINIFKEQSREHFKDIDMRTKVKQSKKKYSRKGKNKFNFKEKY